MVTGFNLLNARGRGLRVEGKEDWSPVRDVCHEAHVSTGVPPEKLGGFLTVQYKNNIHKMAADLESRAFLTCKDEAWLEIDRKWMGEMVMAQAFGVPFLPGKAKELGIKYKQRIADRSKRVPFKSLGSEAEWEKYLGVLLPRTATGRPSANKHNKDEVLALHPGYQELYDQRRDALLYGYFHEDKADLKSNVFQYQGASPYRDGVYLYGEAKYFGTRTGRIQYQAPAYTNIAKGEARSAVGHEEGGKWKVLGMDVKGLEYAMLGLALKKLAKDLTIWNQIRRKQCPKQTTVDIFQHLLGNVAESDRKDVAKTLNYAVLYGMQMRSILNLLKQEDTDETREEVKAALARRFPALTELEEILKKSVDGKLRMRNLFGTPVYAYSNKGSRVVPLNTYIQSSGSYYCKSVFREFLVALRQRCPEARLFLQVHDEIQVSVPADLKEDTVEEAIAAANEAVAKRHSVIAPFDWGFGWTWDQTH